ncbi:MULTISPECIES: nitrate- and nitrite sensing domain-containing protein [unclassified Streptomyces]|uniref:sensor histidine kinase n=1 Tax=unclassified Streptomyces TaxID=2593676 RepID=UPI0009A1257F|nr:MULTISPECIES: nitrate- and nitrite sensing domain-containing protein [unclassified Streptomyces]
MRFRGKSIRRKIVALLLVPLVSLTALWGFATYLTSREAGHLLDVGHVLEKVGHPLEGTVRVIQQERRQSLIYLADPRTADAHETLRRHRAATDRALDALRADARDPRVTGTMDEAAAGRLASLMEALDGLETLRRSVDTRAVGRIQALEFYNRLIDPCYTFLVHLHTLDDVEMDKQARALVGLARAREMVAREDALIVSSLISNRLTAEEVRLLSDLVARREQLYEVNLEILPSSEREVFQLFWREPVTEPLREAEETVVASGPTGDPARVVDAVRWEQAANAVLSGLAAENTEAGARYQKRVEPAAYGVLLQAGVAGILGFLALLASVVVSVRIGRSLVRDLTRLRKEAQDVSGVRLPSVMRRLAAGEHVDVETEVPHLEFDRNEMGQVGKALNTLQRAAVEAAVKQADMRRGISEVSVNLARRNQVLLHRQLTLLDAMERRTEDTEELADLFRLDHLTTRMRRHAEGLVILSGAAPSRQWRRPVQLMDVVRAAVGEVEDYERIEVRRLPRIGVSGPAVADLTHLVAELLENATVFSPPHTAVQVLGERVANGFTLEIHDRGLGMSAEDMLDANLRLAETPEFELSDTDRLGLFVVSRLARRQDVRVSLQPSPYGGTTAVVFIPAALLTDAPATEGAGFRLDRAAQDRLGKDRRDDADRKISDRRQALEAAVLNGPVELDEPLELRAPLGLLGELDDEWADPLPGARGQDHPGGEPRRLLRSRPALRPAGESERHRDDNGARPGSVESGTDRLAAPVPLPRRRKQPTLIARHGRRLDVPHPSRSDLPDPGQDPRRPEPRDSEPPSRPGRSGILQPLRSQDQPPSDARHPAPAERTTAERTPGRVPQPADAPRPSDSPRPTPEQPQPQVNRARPYAEQDQAAEPYGHDGARQSAEPAQAQEPSRPSGRSGPVPGPHAALKPLPTRRSRRDRGDRPAADEPDGSRMPPPDGGPAPTEPPHTGPGPAQHTPGHGKPEPDETALTLRGLPRRVRQASLVPQLRQPAERGGTPRPAAPAHPTPETGHDTDRDAEEVRLRMSAMQRGWQRARREEGPGTTPEGNGR